MLDPASAQKLIKAKMPVVCSEDGQFAVVDHMEGKDVIKLAKDSDGHHHYIPLKWVTAVDDKVHIDRPGDQAKQEWWSAPSDGAAGDLEAARAEAATPDADSAADAAALDTPHVNSVDATVGQPLISRVMTRKHELEALLAGLPADERTTRGDIELALSTAEGLLTGDLAHLPAVVAADLNQWLERNKHLAERAPAA